MEVIWTDLAYESLANIIEYVQGFFGENIALKVAKQIIAFTKTLKVSPHIGKRVAIPTLYGEIRCVYYKQNHIYYKLFEDRIEILIVWANANGALVATTAGLSAQRSSACCF